MLLKLNTCNLSPVDVYAASLRTMGFYDQVISVVGPVPNQFRFPKRLPGWHPSGNHESSQVSCNATWHLKTFSCIDDNLWPNHQYAQLEVVCPVAKVNLIYCLFSVYLGTLFKFWLEQWYNNCVDLTWLPVFILHFHCRFFFVLFLFPWMVSFWDFTRAFSNHFCTLNLHLQVPAVLCCAYS